MFMSENSQNLSGSLVKIEIEDGKEHCAKKNAGLALG